jgi:hypothetical protein
MVIIRNTKKLKGIRKSAQLFIRHFFEYSVIIFIFAIVSGIGMGINYFLTIVYPSLSTQSQMPFIGKILITVIVLAIDIPVSAWISTVFTLTFLKHTSNS